MLKRLLFHNFNRAHRLSSGFRSRVSPLGRLLLLAWLLAGVFGADTKSAATYQLFTLLSALALLALAWNAAARRAFPVVAAQRHLPRHATVGEPLRYSLTFVHSGSKIQRGVRVLDRLSSSLPEWAEFAAGSESSRRNRFDRYVGFYKWRRLLNAKRGANIEEQPLPDLLPQQAAAIELEILPLRRGRLQFAELCLLRPDPFGLFRTLHRLALPQSCCVLPKRYPLAPLPVHAGRAYQRGGVALAQAVGESDEFLSLRDYRPGDALRNVHWRSSAKFGRWVVKEFQDEYFVRRALVLDTFAAPARAEDFEAAVSAAASLALYQPERDALLDLVFVEGQAHCFTAGRGLADAAALLEVLAGVQLSRQGEFRLLAHSVLSRAKCLSSVACVLLDDDAGRLQFCRALAAQGLPVDVLLVREQASTVILPEGISLRWIRPSRLADDLLAGEYSVMR